MKIEFVRVDRNDYVITEIMDRDPSCQDCDFHERCPFEDFLLKWGQVFKKKKK